MKKQLEIDWLFFDFDGVLTDNRVWVFDDGREAVACTRADGLGFSLLRKAGITCMIISTEDNPVVSQRAKKLKLEVMQGVRDKGKAVRAICRREKIDPQRAGFVGNDVNDLPALKVVGHRFCPSDAALAVKNICSQVLTAKGGGGVVREIAERLGLDWGGS